MTVKKNIRRMLLILLILLLLMCGAGAFFIEKKEERAHVSTAQLDLQLVEAPTAPITDREVTKDTAIRCGIVIKNIGTTPVYISSQPGILKDGKEVQASTATPTPPVIITSEGTDQSIVALKPGESRTVYYQITFPGADDMDEGEFSLEAIIRADAYTDPDRKYGFTAGPYTKTMLSCSGDTALMIPLKNKKLTLEAEYESGSVYSSEKWFLSKKDPSESLSDSDWTEFTKGAEIVIQKDVPVYVRYELQSTAGTVRSPIWKLYIKDKELVKEEYDYFTKQKV